MSYQPEDMYRVVESHCHDCKEDVAATVTPMFNEITAKNLDLKIEKSKRNHTEMIIDVSIPVKLKCLLCSGFNVGDVIIKVTIGKDGVVVG